MMLPQPPAARRARCSRLADAVSLRLRFEDRPAAPLGVDHAADRAALVSPHSTLETKS